MMKIFVLSSALVCFALSAFATTLTGNSDITLSNNNLTATHSGTTARDAIAAGNTFQSTGKFTFTVKMASITANHTEIGMASAATLKSTGNWLGPDTQSFGIRPDGTVIYNSNIQGSLGISYGAGSTVDIAIDIPNRAVQERVNGGAWSTVIAFPGLSLTGLTPAVALYSPREAATFSFTTDVGLAGYTSWDSQPPPLVGSQLLVGLDTTPSGVLPESDGKCVMGVSGVPAYAACPSQGPAGPPGATGPKGADSTVPGPQGPAGTNAGQTGLFTPGAFCTVGQSGFDAGFIYVCVASNTWKKVAVQ